MSAENARPAMLDGVRNKISPGQPLDKDIYDLPPEQLKDVPKPPRTLEDALIALVEDNTGTPARLIRVAITYWASYPDEIDAEITAASNAEAAAEDAWRRERHLLTG